MSTMKDVFARRAGRLAFGVVMLLGAARLVIAVYASAQDGAGSHDIAATHLVMTWGIAVGAGVAVWAIAAYLPVPSSTAALWTRSLVIPTLGAALLLPLTLHMLVFLVLGDRSSFDAWVGASLWVTGPAHLVFAILSALRAHRLALGRTALSPLQIYGYTVEVSCVPFAMIVLPPMLVAITGLPILPLLRAMERWITRERAELAALPSLPRAKLILPPR